MKQLDGKIINVIGSKSLKDHAVCLTSEGEVSIEMEKVFSTMPGGETAKAQKVLEINVDHPIFEKLKELSVSDQEKFNKLVFVLFEQAKLIAGLKIDDATNLTDTIFSLIC